MIDIDSMAAFANSVCTRYGPALLVAISLPLGGCVTAPELVLGHGLSQRIDGDVPQIAHAFAGTCLAGEMDPARIIAAAAERGWREADPNSLENAGLGRLKRSVSEMPGGGGRFRDDQLIMVLDTAGGAVEGGSIHMEVLTRHDRDGDRSLSCSLFARSDLLTVCEAAGRIIGRPPDANTHYESREARFISWDVTLDGMAGSISCSQAPHSGWLRYDGVELAAEIRAEESVTMAKIRSSPPRSDDQGR